MSLSADILKSVFGQRAGAFEAFHSRRSKRVANRVAGPAFIRCRVGKSGDGYIHSTIYTSSGMQMRNTMVQIEIDQIGKTVRLRVAPVGEAGFCASKDGLFGGVKDIVRTCGTCRIPMSLNIDGWWYGRVPSTAPQHKE